jgi:hypothetical protein
MNMKKTKNKMKFFIIFFIIVISSCAKYNFVKAFKKNRENEHFTTNKYYISKESFGNRLSTYSHALFLKNGTFFLYENQDSILKVDWFLDKSKNDFKEKGYYYKKNNTIYAYIYKQSVHQFTIKNENILIKELKMPFDESYENVYILSSLLIEKAF